MPMTDPASPNSSGPSAADHLAAIVLPLDPAPAADIAAPGGISSPAAAPIMSKADFFGAFRFLLGAPNIFVAPPLDSLKVEASDDQARAASDAIYDTALEVPWLRWLLEPENVWVRRAVVIGLFAYGKGSAVRAELAARAKTRQGASPAVAGVEAGPTTSAPFSAPPLGPQTVVLEQVSR
jgi:hypothetical protein